MDDRNLSKEKRDRLVDMIQRIRENDIDEDMRKALAEIEDELVEKRFGLVWEEHQERVDSEMKDGIPVFVEDKEKEIISDESADVNFLLEGDNLHSLYLLEKTHKGLIDMIYIDPPYNTGTEDFMYNDKYIGDDDNFKHSKWLSFMEKRLRIAYKLLADNGFIFISIDDKEAAPLRLLCDEIFDENNYQNTTYIQVRYPDKTLTQDMNYHKQIEQVLVYRKSPKAKPHLEILDYDYDKFIYSIIEKGKGREIELGGKKVEIFDSTQYEIVQHEEGFKEGLKEIWASGTVLNKNSSGRFFRDYLTGRKDIDGLGVMYKVYGIGDDQYDYRYFTGPKRANATKGKYYQGVPVEKLEDGATRTFPIPNFYDMAGDFGNISQEGGVDFNSGKKPIKLINMFLDYFEDKNITVLDFFAGSASTGHAVLRKNAEDGGHRKFILCTNNEKKICEEKAYIRLKNVINGYGKYSAIPTNLKYYKTDFVPKESDDDDYIVESMLLKYVKEMVQLENHIRIDGMNYIILLTDEEADTLENNPDMLANCNIVYHSSGVLISKKLKQLIISNGVEFYEIPDCYFAKELSEVGEI